MSKDANQVASYAGERMGAAVSLNDNRASNLTAKAGGFNLVMDNNSERTHHVYGGAQTTCLAGNKVSSRWTWKTILA